MIAVSESKHTIILGHKNNVEENGSSQRPDIDEHILNRTEAVTMGRLSPVLAGLGQFLNQW
jgi:hypothetical protein